MKHILGAALLAAMALETLPALASGDDSAAAGALFRQARDDIAHGDYAAACPRFAESFRLEPTTGTLLNLADCNEHVGRLADALAQFERALETLPKQDDRVDYTRDRIAKLAPRVPHVRLRARGPSVDIVLDGSALGRAALDVPLPLNPGDHTVVVHAPGRRDRAYDLAVRESTRIDLDLEPGEVAPETPPPPEHAGAQIPATTGNGARTTLAWSALAVGALGLAVGATAGVMALGAASDTTRRCPDHLCTSPADVDAARTGKAEATVSTVGFGVGIVGAAVAVYLLSRGDGPKRASAAPVFIGGPGVAGLSWSATFR